MKVRGCENASALVPIVCVLQLPLNVLQGMLVTEEVWATETGIFLCYWYQLKDPSFHTPFPPFIYTTEHTDFRHLFLSFLLPHIPTSLNTLTYICHKSLDHYVTWFLVTVFFLLGSTSSHAVRVSLSSMSHV